MLMVTPGEKIRLKREALGLTQTQLGDAVGTNQQTIEKIENGLIKRSSYLPAVAARLGLHLDELDPSYRAVREATGSLVIPGGHLMSAERDFRVYASAEGGPGEIIRSTDPIDWVPRPGPVMHVKDAYGLVVSGSSMEPEFRPGDTLIINPKLPIIGGESYVFYAEKDGEARASVKYLRRATTDSFRVSQWNPPRDFNLSRKEWSECHRVRGKYSRS